MESRKQFESCIKRTTPEIPIAIQIGNERKAVLLRYDNTLVCTHDEEYQQFDHIMILDESIAGEPIYIFRGDDGEFGLGELLMQQGFDNYDRIYPSVEDEERWFQWEMRDINDILGS